VKGKIEKICSTNKDWIIETRRYLHQYPELSQKEEKTSQYIYKTLKNMNIKVEKGYYGTGVVAIIDGYSSKNTIGIRFDMDALQITEKNNVSYVSKNPGVMHACGHDGHMAIGLGLAKVLSKIKNNLYGTVKLIFQPAEEDAFNGGGAQYLIKEGALNKPEVDAMIGLHIWPDLPFNKVGTRAGVIMGSSDPIIIKLKGKGAHASQPSQGIDPIVIGSQVINGLQTIVSRNISPFEQAVISIGKFEGGTRYNIIPETVTLKGTVRTFDEETREKVKNRIKTISKNVALGLGGEAKIDYNLGYPPLVNDSKMVELAEKSIKQILGSENYINISNPAPTGEDFAFFAKEKPSVFYWLGCNKEGEKTPKLHSPYFDFDEEILLIGIKAISQTIINFFDNYNK